MGPRKKKPATKHIVEGKYANYFKVGHNAFEFVIDFGQYHAETEEAELYTRIYTGPAHAKALLKVLQDSVNQFEASFGAIDEGSRGREF